MKVYFYRFLVNLEVTTMSSAERNIIISPFTVHKLFFFFGLTALVKNSTNIIYSVIVV